MVSASFANGPKIYTLGEIILSWRLMSPLPLIQKEQVASNWQKNGHLSIGKLFPEACPGTVWFGK